jgi:hypothetical protein
MGAPSRYDLIHDCCHPVVLYPFNLLCTLVMNG